MLRNCRLVVLHPPALRIPIRNAETQEILGFLCTFPALILVFRFFMTPQINLAIDTGLPPPRINSENLREEEPIYALCEMAG